MNFSRQIHLILFIVEGAHQGLDLLGSLKGRDQIAILVIECQVGEIMNTVERNKEEFLIPSDLDIGVLGQMVMLVKILHLAERLISGHDDLDILEFGEAAQHTLGLMLAVLTVGTEEHDQRTAVPFQIFFCHIAGTVHF